MGLTTSPSAAAHGADVNQLPHGVVRSFIDSVNRMGLPVNLPHGREMQLVVSVNPIGLLTHGVVLPVINSINRMWIQEIHCMGAKIM